MKILIEPAATTTVEPTRYCHICEGPIGTDLVIMSVWYGRERHPDQLQCHYRCADRWKLDHVKDVLMDRDEIPF